MNFLIIFILICQFTAIYAGQINIVRIHYDGGGDWYGNKTTWVNIFERFEQEFDVEVAPREVAYKITDPEFRQFPIAYIAGHGNIRFSEEESRLLRIYLTSGGFLYADDW